MRAPSGTQIRSDLLADGRRQTRFLVSLLQTQKLLAQTTHAPQPPPKKCITTNPPQTSMTTSPVSASAAAGADGHGAENNDAAAVEVAGEAPAAAAAAAADDARPPWDDKVDCHALKDHDLADLTASAWYNEKNEGQKPIALMVMGIGVPGFPSPEQIENNEDIVRVTNRSKSHKCNKEDIVPTVPKAKSYLKKETIRRVLVKEMPNKDHPKLNHWDRTKLTSWLMSNPPPNLEHGYINQSFNALIAVLKTHYQVTSGSKEANMWRLIRLFECFLHPSLRDDFKKRNRQLTRHEIDGRNSPHAPKSFYEKVADLHNSSVILYSVILGESYGEPFHERKELGPVLKENHVTGQSVKETMNTTKGGVIRIRNGIRVSGQGEGSHCGGDTVKGFVTGAMSATNKKAVAANGEATAYILLRTQDEGIIDDFCSHAGDGVAATMKNTPRINSGSGKKRKGKSTQRSGKKGTSDRTRTELLQSMRRMQRNQDVEEHKLSIQMLRQQITSEESSLLNHREKLTGFITACLPFKQQVRNGTLTEADEDEWEMYQLHNGNVVACKNAIASIASRIKSLNAELESNEKKYAEAEEAAELAEGEEEEEGESKEAEEEDEYNWNESENDDNDIFSVGSNNGSEQLNDNEIPDAESVN